MLFNSALNLDVFKDISLRKSLWAAKITKIGHLIPEGEWLSAETFAEKLGIRSVRVAKKILTQIAESLPQSYRLSLETYNGEMDTFDFPELEITSELENWEETEGGLLSFKTPQLGVFSNTGKKSLYTLSRYCIFMLSQMLRSLNGKRCLD